MVVICLAWFTPCIHFYYTSHCVSNTVIILSYSKSLSEVNLSRWALPDQMAQAGFYHQPNASGDDRAMCFACNVCLVCWERTDEPWSEHERHSPTCPFVAGEYTQNVPLSVTHATNPATSAVYRGTPAHTLGSSSVSGLFATANGDGLVSVFDVSGRVNRQQSFFVTHFDSHVLEKFTQDFGMPGWIDIQEGNQNNNTLFSILVIQ